jgi:hypothetical protein
MFPFSSLIEGGYVHKFAIPNLLKNLIHELDQAVKLVRELNSTWPGIYAVRDSEGNDIELPE